MKDVHGDLYEKEVSYWWSVAQRSEVSAVYFKFCRHSGFSKVLDLGCGGGALLSGLKNYAKVFGIDSSFKACKYSKEKIDNILQSDALRLPFKDGCFDTILVLDLIEHIDNEMNLLREIKRVCAKGGVCIMTVPAWRCLWSERDDWLGHKRRYTVTNLKTTVEKVGFEIIKCNYVHGLLFIILYLTNQIRRILRYGKIKTDIITVPDLLNSFLIYLFEVERKLFSVINPPLGTSIICVAKKC
jgi:SAM-dependent methyltransferase